MRADYHIMLGNVMDILPTLPAASIDCTVTSPPYYGMRDYGVPPSVWDQTGECEHHWSEPLPGQSRFCKLCNAWLGSLGLEPTPQLYVRHLDAVFQEVHRVLTRDGTLWLNLGDSYAGSGKGKGSGRNKYTNTGRGKATPGERLYGPPTPIPPGLRRKNLLGIPWRTAFALQDNGWILRKDVIWQRPNTPPESVKDRPTSEHEYLFMLTKQPLYHYDADAIAEPTASGQGSRNKRSVWRINNKPYAGDHPSSFPVELPETCLLASCPPDGTVLDPFCGSAATGVAALRHGRSFIGIDVNPLYERLAHQRIRESSETST